MTKKSLNLKNLALVMSHMNPSTRSLLRLFTAFALSASLVDVSAQESPKPIHQQTTPPLNARYELVQSTLAARLTFRLDRFTGRVWQLVRTKDDDNMWEEMTVLERPPAPTNTRARYLIFTSGLAARYTFLIDTETGKSWIVVSSKRKNQDGSEYDVSLWQPFAE